MKKILFLAFCLIATALHAEPDAKKLALARDVIKAAKADKMIEGMTEQIKAMTAGPLKAKMATMTPEEIAKAEKVQDLMMAAILESAKKLIHQMDTVYADVFTEKELQAMKAFYESPEGKSMVDKQPKVMEQLMPLVKAMQAELYPKLQTIIQESKLDSATQKVQAIAK